MVAQIPLYFWIITLVYLGGAYALNPPIFDGNPTQWNVWVRSVQAYFLLKDITDDGERVGVALMFMAMKVATYVEPMITDAMTWEAFKTLLQERYQTGDHIVTEYLAKFNKVRQTSDASSYCDYFNSLIHVLAEGGLTMTVVQQRTQFINGLQPVLARMVVGQGPATLEQAQEMARNYAANPAVRSEFSANPTSANPPAQPHSARKTGTNPTAAAAISRDDAMKRRQVFYALTNTDKDFAELYYCEDTQASYSAIHPTIANWLGLNVFDVPPKTLYMFDSTPLVLTKATTFSMRLTKTQVAGTPITCYLCPVPYNHVYLSENDYKHLWMDGGEKLRVQTEDMKREEMVEEVGKVALAGDPQKSRQDYASTIHSPKPGPTAEIIVLEPSISDLRLPADRRPTRVTHKKRHTRTPRDDPFITKDPIPITPTESDVETAPDPVLANEILAYLDGPREGWGWRQYYDYVRRLKVGDLPKVPYIKDPGD